MERTAKLCDDKILYIMIFAAHGQEEKPSDVYDLGSIKFLFLFRNERRKIERYEREYKSQLNYVVNAKQIWFNMFRLLQLLIYNSFSFLLLAVEIVVLKQFVPLSVRFKHECKCIKHFNVQHNFLIKI